MCRWISAIVAAHLLSMCAAYSTGSRSYTPYREDMPCRDLKAQNALDIDSVTGIWFGIEVILHQKYEQGVEITDTCLFLHIAEITYEVPTTESNAPWHIRAFNTEGWESAPRRLRLLWDEGDRNLEYALRFNDTKLGVWSAAARQNGTIADLQPYNQFVGTVQVIKAVDNHLVLTFCQQQPEAQLFSLVLGREPYGLTRVELRSIHGLLNRRNLPTRSIRKVCGNGAAPNVPGSWVALVVAVVAAIRFSEKML